VVAAVIATVQLIPLLDVHPVQPAKLLPAEGAAVSVIDVPCASVSVQSAPQLIPVPVTVPEPPPSRCTVSG
jgi:hypothetical protein